MLLHVAVFYHAVHGPSRRVGMSPELRLRQVAVGDVAIHPHVGHRSFAALLKAAVVLSRIVLAPVSCAGLLSVPVGMLPVRGRRLTAAVVSGQDIERIKHAVILPGLSVWSRVSFVFLCFRFCLRAGSVADLRPGFVGEFLGQFFMLLFLFGFAFADRLY